MFFLTRENITLAMSIFGSVGTIISFTLAFLHNRKKVKISILNFEKMGDVYLFFIMFENLSRLPISISRISLISNDFAEDCFVTPEFVLEYNKSTEKQGVYERKVYYSEQIPINLSPLGAISGYLLFPALEEQTLIDVSRLTILQVYTNRGKVKKIEFVPQQVPPFRS